MQGAPSTAWPVKSWATAYRPRKSRRHVQGQKSDSHPDPPPLSRNLHVLDDRASRQVEEPRPTFAHGYGRLSHFRNLYVAPSRHTGQMESRRSRSPRHNGGLNDRSLRSASLWRLAAHDDYAVVRHRVPEHHRVRACGRALRVSPDVASGQFRPSGRKHLLETSTSKHFPSSCKRRLSVIIIPRMLRPELVVVDVIAYAGPQQRACVLIGAEVDSSINACIRDVIGDRLES
jgi:hypothetical protein